MAAKDGELKKINPDELLKGVRITNVKDTAEKVMQGFKDDAPFYAELKRLDLKVIDIKNNLPLLMEFQDNFRECRETDHLPPEEAAGPAFAMSVIKTEDGLKATYGPRKNMLKRESRRSFYLFNDFPDEWLDKSLSDVELTAKRNTTIIKMADLAGKISNKWLYLTGEAGTGRTYMCACFANDYIDANQEEAAFCSCLNLIDRLRDDSINRKDEFKSLMKQLQEIPLLVLDGFGDEYKSDFAFSNVLYPLISERSKGKRLTIIISDFTIEDVYSMYASKVSEPRARQLASLLRKEVGKETRLEGLANL